MSLFLAFVCLTIVVTNLTSKVLSKPFRNIVTGSSKDLFVDDETKLKHLGGRSLKALLCKDIVISNVNLWGALATGVYLTKYTFPLQFIGCNGNGCHTSDFFCTESNSNSNSNSNSIKFGITGTTGNDAMRALIGPYKNDSVWPHSFTGCCSSTNPQNICNSPDDHTSATQLCKQLGYQEGTLTYIFQNNCPQVYYNGHTWTSTFIAQAGFGQQYTCTGGGPVETCVFTADNNAKYKLDLSLIANNTISSSISNERGNSIKYIPCPTPNELFCGTFSDGVGAGIYSSDFGCVAQLINKESTLKTIYNEELKRWELLYITEEQCGESVAVFEIYYKCNINVPKFRVQSATSLGTGTCTWQMTIESSLVCM